MQTSLFPDHFGIVLFSASIVVAAIFFAVFKYCQRVRRHDYARIWELANSVFENQTPQMAQVKEVLAIFKRLHTSKESSQLPYIGLYLRRAQKLIRKDLTKAELSLDEANRAWREHLDKRTHGKLVSTNDYMEWGFENTRMCNRRALLFSQQVNLEREMDEIDKLVLKFLPASVLPASLITTS